MQHIIVRYSPTIARFFNSTRCASSLQYNLKPGDSLYVSKTTDWLEARYHFDFMDYRDSTKKRHKFGVLRVVNDDLIQPHMGFETHPHKDMEIFTYILEGELTHKDSMGSAETLKRGHTQYMSAGTGVTHSEYNNGDKLARVLQLWCFPNRNGYKPQYGSIQCNGIERQNKLLHLLGGEGPERPPHAIKLHQDVDVFVSELEANREVSYEIKPARQAYIVCAEGSLTINGEEQAMGYRDGLEVKNPSPSSVEMLFKGKKEGAHFVMVDMPIA